MRPKIVVVGGGGAGLSAAFAAKRTNFEADVTVISNEQYSYSPCALPFVLAGEIGVEDIRRPIRRVCEESEIHCLVDEASNIDSERRFVETKGGERLSYTSLVIATGGLPLVPPIPGTELEGVFTLKTMRDVERILAWIKSRGVEKAVVIGGGAIGVEVSAALRKRRIEVTLIEMCSSLMPRAFDPDVAKLLAEKLQREGIRVVLGRKVEGILGRDEVEAVRVGDAFEAEIVVFGTGVIPNVELAKRAGVEIVERGIKVDGWMQTSVKHVYAAGDCVDSRSLVTNKLTLSQLGTTATRQGRVAGTNAAGGYMTFEGVLNSLLLQVFDLEVGRTGLTEDEAREAGLEVTVGTSHGKTRAEYFPGARDIHVKLIFNTLTRELVGAQLVGGEGVAGKVDLLAFAIAKHAKLEELLKLKYCYTPSLASLHHPVVMAAENALRRLQRLEEVRRRWFWY